MSYCVNCGVELHKSAAFCPLCNTVVINPVNPPDTHAKPPYPAEIGKVENVNSRGVALLLTVVFVSIALAALLLNLFLFKEGLWSAFVMGASLLLWVFTVPVLILRPSRLLIILLDGAVISLYCFIIARQTDDASWYFGIALPIIIMLTGFVFLFGYVVKRFKTSILFKTAFIFGELGFYTVGIELSIRYFLYNSFSIRWSAVVGTSCLIIVAVLTTVMKNTRLREEVQRRLHF